MKLILWNEEKNEQLKANRGIGFDTIALSINQGLILDIVEHPNQDRYPNQRIFILVINQYVYLVPFVEDEQSIFLKTIIPSRKMKKRYLGE
jgi:uncharacterized DUF497 family protein